MAIASNYVFTYGEIVSKTLEKIKAKCHNIDSFSNEVPALYKNGSSVTIATTSIPESKQPWPPITWRDPSSATLTGTVSDPLLTVVSSSTVSTQLNNYLMNVGITQKTDEVMSTKALMQFFNHLASFMAAKLVYVHSAYLLNTFGARGLVFYNASNTNFPTVSLSTYTPAYYTDAQGQPIVKHFFKLQEPYKGDGTDVYVDTIVSQPNTENLDAEFNFIHNTDGVAVETSVQEFLDTLSTPTRIHIANVSLSFASCSSCSSSSSIFLFISSASKSLTPCATFDKKAS